ncbi:SpoIIE family protein phosphatase [Anaerovorax sp. IOR16]|uniref:SpoIIE family protein phosphatase n=1 Tax=Anaerovorax sp. IOR16 TaxID=2773458 RepID=UPI0019D316EA|nr:SpoIIE family protein phosphatase [Anaerovorax sp. IOR16]
MELLMDNLKTVLAERQKIKGENLSLIFSIIGTLVFAFFVSRVSFFYYMYPCGVALVTLLMSREKGNIYVLPVILLSLLTNQKVGYPLWGDLLAVGVCGVFFFFWKKNWLSLSKRAMFAAGITIIIKVVYGLNSQVFYLYDGVKIGGEGLLILFFTHIFARMFTLMEENTSKQKSTAENIATVTIVALVFVAGAFPSLIFELSPVYIGALLLSIMIGYKLGIMEGAVCGVVGGLMIMGLANGMPSISGILACGGMTAGVLRREHRILCALGFMGVCLCFGVLRGNPDLYMAVYEPVLAGAIFVLIPSRILQKVDLLLAKVGRPGARYELVAKKQMKAKLKNYYDTFQYLSLAYGKSRGEARLRSAENSRQVMACQFRGMAKAVGGMMEEIETVGQGERLIPKVVRYSVQRGVSTYAKAEGISGDSYLCTEFRPGEYMMVLSDGMGKGKKAAEESALTVNTLHYLMKAGFDAELALKIINSILLVKSTEEIFSTVDLALLNLYTGRMKLFKIGGAATFIKRGNEVDMIKVSALPIGIIDQIPIESLEVTLRKGDQIILVSDGITEADRGELGLLWLKEAIAGIKSTDPQTAADLIINKAVERCGIRERDDMTVIVTTIL